MDVNLDELVNVGNLTDWLDANVPELGDGPLLAQILRHHLKHKAEMVRESVLDGDV